MKRYDKLVRDKIPEVIAKDGKSCVTRILNDDEFRIHLNAKLEEEVAEFLQKPSTEELADILEILSALAQTLGSNLHDVERIRAKKAEERGGFAEKIFLEHVD